MADVVQYRLERMSDELTDLESRGLFTRPEISEIVKRRRDFEYRIKRPCPIKHDYLLYIDYEKHLDKLRVLRKREILGELRKKEEEKGEEKGGKKWKKSISDHAGVRRIMDVYRMAAARYKGDLEIWFGYLEFCREKKNGKMKEVIAQAIRFHPKVPGLWIYAAAWEFDQNLNVAAARNLMQSGLRACPNSEDLWIEYLRMELTYLNKLTARKVALGEDVKSMEKDDVQVKEWKEDNEDLFMPLDEGREESKGSGLEEGASKQNENLFGQQGSAILQTIYQGAVEALPSSISLRKRFLEVLNSINLANSDVLRKEIMEDFKKDFSHDELYWDWLARLEIVDAEKSKDEFLSKLNKAVSVYEEALNVLRTTKMFSLYTKFWLDTLALDKEDSNSVLSSIGIDATDFTSSVLNVYERAESSGCLTEDLACQYVPFYLHMGRIDEARNLVEKLCNGKVSEGADLWLLRASIEVKYFADKTVPISKDELHSVFRLLTNALPRLSVSKAERLWIMALKTFSNDKDHFEKLVRSLMLELAKAGWGDRGCSVSSAVVNGVLQRDGINRAREMYKRFLALPHPSLEFFRHCIGLESNIAVVGDSDAFAKARKLYESALVIYGQNKELWRDYYTMEMKVGTSETANAVHWRARKTLKDVTGLSVASDL